MRRRKPNCWPPTSNSCQVRPTLSSVLCFSSSRPARLFPVSFSHHLSAFGKNLKLNKSHLEVGRQQNFPLNREKKEKKKKACLPEVHCDCSSLCLGCPREFLAFCGTLVATIGTAHVTVEHVVTSDFPNERISEGNDRASACLGCWSCLL